MQNLIEDPVEKMVQELMAKAKRDGIEAKIPPSKPSSLHRLIKTREQAARFMFLLKAAEDGLI